MRRRRPLMRAAMVGGGAYVAGKHVARGQEEKADQEARIEQLEAQQAAPAPPAPAPAPAAAPAGGGSDLVDKIKELSDLKGAGVLTEEEFAKLIGK